MSEVEGGGLDRVGELLFRGLKVLCTQDGQPAIRNAVAILTAAHLALRKHLQAESTDRSRVDQLEIAVAELTTRLNATVDVVRHQAAADARLTEQLDALAKFVLGTPAEVDPNPSHHAARGSGPVRRPVRAEDALRAVEAALDALAYEGEPGKCEAISILATLRVRLDDLLEERYRKQGPATVRFRAKR